MCNRGVGVESESKAEISRSILGIVFGNLPGNLDDKLQSIHRNHAEHRRDGYPKYRASNYRRAIIRS
jgi:hypothetical protein